MKLHLTLAALMLALALPVCAQERKLPLVDEAAGAQARKLPLVDEAAGDVSWLRFKKQIGRAHV